MTGDPIDNRGFDTTAGAPKGEYTDGKSEAWGSVDSPFLFSPDIVTAYADLPKKVTKGHASSSHLVAEEPSPSTSESD